MFNKTVAVIALVVFLTGCSTVTIQPQATNKFTNNPTFESSEDFFFWGLVGEKRINVKEICKDKPVKQMQSQNTFKDGLFAFLTLGIYAPRSVKIWCE
jgi:hypothetical protein